MSDIEIIGVGSPIVDLVVQVDDHFLGQHISGAKGGMELIECDALETHLAKAPSPAQRCAGGAASNTTVGCAQLGLRTAFIGSIGDDEYGIFYRQSLIDQGCEPRLLVHDFLPTGRVLCMITPDAQRTMRTYLGAAVALDPACIRADRFEDARLVMLEGYALYQPTMARTIAAAAHEAGCQLALDLASFEVVEAHRDLIAELLDGPVDLVFANQDEALAWCPDGIEAALEDLAARTRVAAVKMGADGAWILSQGQRHHVEALTVEAVDTTGAGDCWAAGFLAGYLRNLPLDVCGTLGAMAGAAVVQVTGAQPSREQWLQVRGYLEAFA